MKKLVVIACIILAACAKTIAEKVRQQTALTDNTNEVSYNRPLRLDVNNDGIKDIELKATVVPDFVVKNIDFTAKSLNGAAIAFDENRNWIADEILLGSRDFTEGPSNPRWEGQVQKRNCYLIVMIKGEQGFYTKRICITPDPAQSVINAAIE